MDEQWIPLCALLAADQYKGCDNALGKVLGDAYLYKHNSLFRRVRDVAVEYGCEFVSDAPDLLMRYQGLPFVCLREIVENRRIPYFDNLTVLRSLLCEQPNIKWPIQFLLQALKRNYVLHETTHCIAHALLNDDPLVIHHFPPKEKFVVESVLTEACANAVERLASGSRCARTHMLMFTINSYMNYNPAGRQQLETATARYGIHALFPLAVVSYFAANFRGRATEPRLIHCIAETGAECHSLRIDGATAQELVTGAFSINDQFREQTSLAYFSCYGCAGEFRSLSTLRWLYDDTIAEELAEYAYRIRDRLMDRGNDTACEGAFGG
jgi:hypothetical protein